MTSRRVKFFDGFTSEITPETIVVPEAGFDATAIADGSISNTEFQDLVNNPSRVSVDNTIPRYDGDTGQVIQTSNVVISDTNNMSGVLDLTLDGSMFLFNAGGSYREWLPVAGIKYNRSYSPTYTIENWWAVGDVAVDDLEATLSLTRSDVGEVNSEFIDLFNNGYHTSSDITHGLAIQKRGTGVYRDFVFRTYDGTTKRDIFKIDVATNTPQYYDGSNWSSVASLDAIQTFTNKSVSDSLTMVNQASVSFLEQTGNGTNFIKLQAPDVVTADTTFKLPDGDGTVGQVLKTDGSANLSWIDVVVPSLASTVTAAGTTTLLATSSNTQEFTGATTQTVVLPTTSVNAGQKFTFINNSTGIITIQSSGLNDIIAMEGGSKIVVTALVATPTTASNWDITVGTLATTTSAGLIKAEKQYVGGVDFTITSDATGSPVFQRAVIVPYQTVDGAWRARINCTLTHGSETSHNITISGLVFKDVTDFFQPITALTTSGTVYTSPNTGVLIASTPVGTTSTGLSGDVELESKPTWAE